MNTDSTHRRDTRSLEEKARSVVKKLREAGFESYFAGGCVRDMLLGTLPKDYDIATGATPDEVIALFPKTIAIGAQFGVIQVRYGGEGFEVATFRTDGGYSDGRRPDNIEYATAKHDVERRDFTINGLLYDPIEERVLDFVEGEKDLERKLIRAIGNPVKRIGEDRLRMLRAVRFAARLNFAIDEPTLRAIQTDSHSIGQVSAERIREELFRMFAEGGGTYGVTLLFETQLYQALFPQTWIQNEKDEARARLASKGLPNGAPLLFFALLLHDLSLEEAEVFAKGMTFSKHERKRLLNLLSGLSQIRRINVQDTVALKRLVRQEHWEDLIHLAGALQSVDLLPGPTTASLSEYRAKWSDADLYPAVFLDGNSLRELGLSPGPHFKRILEDLEDKQLGGEIHSREEAIDWVNQIQSTS